MRSLICIASTIGLGWMMGGTYLAYMNIQISLICFGFSILWFSLAFYARTQAQKVRH